MKHYAFEAVTYDGSVYCVGCLPNGISIDDDEVEPIVAGQEVDSYPTCDACGTEHDYMALLEGD